MIISFLTMAVGSVITSSMIVESVTAGVGLGVSIYTASKATRQKSNATRRRRSS